MSTEAPLRVACVVGTRPEAIKMAPVVLELKKDLRFEPRLLATGQHAQMLYQALEPFGLEPDEDLKVMRDRQSLDYITASVLEGVGAVLDSWKPRAVLVHGDTTTTLAALSSAAANPSESSSRLPSKLFGSSWETFIMT